MTQYRILQPYERTREGDRYFVPGDSSPRTCTHRQLDIGAHDFWPDGTKAERVIRAIRPVEGHEYLRWFDVGERIAGLTIRHPKCNHTYVSDTPLWDAKGDTTKTYEPRAGDVVRYRRGSVAASTIRSVADGQVHYTNGGWDHIETLPENPDVVIIRDGNVIKGGDHLPRVGDRFKSTNPSNVVHEVAGITQSHVVTTTGSLKDHKLFSGPNPAYRVIKEPADEQENQKEAVEAHGREVEQGDHGRSSRGVGASAPTETRVPGDPYLEHRRKLAEPRRGIISRLDALTAHAQEVKYQTHPRGGGNGELAHKSACKLHREFFNLLASVAKLHKEGKANGPPFDDEPPVEQTEDDFGRALYAENIEDPHVEKPKRTDYADNDWDYADWQGKKP